MSKAVIYTRVSSDEQVKNQSLANQQKACREYCQRQGIEVDRVFVDEGQSAKTTDRAEFQNLLAHCRQNKGRVEFVVVWKIDRFSRDRLDHALIVSHLLKLGISLRSVTEPIDGTSTGKLMEGILSTFAQFDNDVRGERTAAGMKSAMAAGRVTHLAPLGYLNTTGPNGEPTLTPDPDRAPFIRQAFEMFASGLHSKGEIVATLTKQGLRTPKGKPIHKQSFAQYLENPIYTGWLVSKKWGVRKRGNFEPIVDEATFAKVQAVLNGSVQSKVPHRRNHADFPLEPLKRAGFTGLWSISTPRKTKWLLGHSQNTNFLDSRADVGNSLFTVGCTALCTTSIPLPFAYDRPDKA